jgi:hypothetical protein
MSATYDNIEAASFQVLETRFFMADILTFATERNV